MTEDRPTGIGVTIGFTASVGNYQSVKVNVSVNDWKRDGESMDDAVERVYAYVEDQVSTRLEKTKREIAQSLKS